LILQGADALIECLKQEGVEVVFGYPGGAVLTLYDALYNSQFPHVLTKHEQGAVHAADGYARVTGKVGVCIATSGPGATNLITGIATAYMDSVPLVAITGQVGVSLIGKDSFQEADICGITTPISKHNYLVKRAQDLPRVIKEAFYIARTGRPGPVVIDIAKDVFAATMDYEYPTEVSLRGYKPLFAGDEEVLRVCLEELRQAKKPLLFVGGGATISNMAPEIRKFVNATGIPVISSLMGLGVVPGDSSEHLGMVGMHGTYAANMATVECDLLLGVGVRFDDRVTGSVEHFAANAKILHFDIDPAEINKNVCATIKVVGDLAWSLPLFNKLVKDFAPDIKEQTAPWREQTAIWKQDKPMTYKSREGVIMPQQVIAKLNELAEDAIVVTDVGQHQMWTAQFFNFRQARAFVTSGGLGTMGYGLPAAIGAQIGLPDKKVIVFCGDGGIMMNCQELATAADNGFPVKVIVMNNQVLGMVSQWQRLFYGERYSHTSLKGRTDYVKLAEAMGVTGFKAEHPGELEDILKKALATSGPVLVEVALPSDEDVMPMVPPGGCLDKMILGEC